MQTRSDAETYLLSIPELFPDQYWIDDLLDELHTIAEGWDFDEIEPELFWTTVADHAIV